VGGQSGPLLKLSNLTAESVDVNHKKQAESQTEELRLQIVSLGINNSKGNQILRIWFLKVAIKSYLQATQLLVLHAGSVNYYNLKIVVSHIVTLSHPPEDKVINFA